MKPTAENTQIGTEKRENSEAKEPAEKDCMQTML